MEKIQKYLRNHHSAIKSALTTNIGSFLQKCESYETDLLCFNAYHDCQWEVTDIPSSDIPSKLSEPKLGINFSRQLLKEENGIPLLAAYLDSTMVAACFNFCLHVGFDKNQRNAMFNIINNYTPVFEVVTRAQKRTRVEVERGVHHTFQKKPKVHAKKIDFCGHCGYDIRAEELCIDCESCRRVFHYKCGNVRANYARHCKSFTCFPCRLRATG